MKKSLPAIILAIGLLTPFVAHADISTGLAGYWTFNNQDMNWTSGTAGTAFDKSGNGNTGTLTNMFRSSSPVAGKLGQALSFNGTNSQVDFGSNTATAYNFASTSFSVSVWVYPTASVANQSPISKITQTLTNGWMVRMQSLNVNMYVRETGGRSATSPSAALVLNQWQLLTFVVDWTNTVIRTYLNGVQVGNGTSIATYGNFDSAYDLLIGDARTASLYPWHGSLDDARIYNRALSASDIKQLYLNGQNTLQSTQSNGCGISSLNCGLAGYWTFNNQDMNWKTDQALDKSRNGNTGNLINLSTSTSPVPGKLGQALSFNGTNQYISVPDSSLIGNATAITVSAWIKGTSWANAYNAIVQKGNGTAFFEYFVKSNGKMSMFIRYGTSGTVDYDGTGADTLSTGTWYMVTMVFGFYTGLTGYVNGQVDKTVSVSGNMISTAGNNLAIGNDLFTASREFNGSIDDVRVYNRALSASEIRQLYLNGQTTLQSTQSNGCGISSLTCGLAGYWTFNNQDMNWTSGTAGTAYDMSGNGNTGKLTNMFQSTSPVAGKLGQALTFNGSSQYVVATSSKYTLTSSPLNLSTEGTVSAWINPNSTAGTGLIVSKENYSTDRNGYGILYLVSGGNTYIRVELCTASAVQFVTTSALPLLDVWTNVTVTWDGSFVAIYINGVNNTGFVAETQTPVSNVYDLNIGKNASGVNSYFPGSIDDTRIYNRALSASEVEQLYMDGGGWSLDR